MYNCSVSAFPEQPARIGEPQSVVLQVELSVTQATSEVIEQWATVIEAVGSVAGQEVKVIDVSPMVRPVPLEAQIEQHFSARLDDFGLTPQERKITELMIHGKTGRQIAKIMGLAEGTVRNTMSRVLRKTDCPARGGLVFRLLGVEFPS